MERALKKQKQTGPSPLVADAARLLNLGQLSAAGDALRRAIAIKPSDADALALLGVVEARQGRVEAALPLMQRVVTLRPTSPDAHYNFAIALHQAKDFAGAEKHYLEALRLRPTSAIYHNNLGTLYQDRADYQQARISFERAIECDPAHENAVVNLCSTYRMLGDMEALDQLTSRAIARWPQNSIHWLNRSQALFFQGRLADAWDCYAWRFKAAVNPAVSRAAANIPEWQGDSLESKSVLLWTEQGPGDEIMYTSMIPDLQKVARRVGLLCTARMAPLFQRSFPGVDVFADVIPPEARQNYEVQCSVVALARTLRSEIAAFDTQSAFLVPDREKAAQLGARYRNGTKDLLVGIAWRSSGVQEAAQKTVSLGFWGALFAIPGVRFINLQYGDCAAEIAGVQKEYRVQIVQDESIDPLLDLDSYAAQVAAMDVVACSSNTAAHFAGGLGVTTHCMITATPGLGRRWYWFEHRGRSAWYPSVQLHAQVSQGSWVDVVRDVVLELAVLQFTRGLEAEIVSFLKNLAAAYEKGGHSGGVIAVWQTLSTLPGQEFISFFEMGRLAKDRGDMVEAEHYFDKALTYNPQSAPVLNMKGVALAAQDRFADAEPFYRAAIAAAPDAAEAYNNLGTAVRRLGRGLEADELYKRANVLLPNHPGILLNLATNLTEISRPAEAISYFDQLLALQPEYSEAHHSRAMALLTSGRFQEGWPELRWRHLVHNDARPSEDELPVWAGQAFTNKSVLVWTEQGLGDEILAMSMLGDLVASNAKVTLLASTRMIPLFRRSFPAVQVVDRWSLKTLKLSKFDYQLSVSELGAAFRPSIEAFPKQIAFLIPHKQTRESLRERYHKSERDVVVGLSWASANPDIGGLKSLTLAQIVMAISSAPEEAHKNIFLSLQYGDHAHEIDTARQVTSQDIILDPSVDALVDMDRFAAQVAAVDVVVTISNTTAHMAGALGIPTLLLLPYNRGRHWYWLRDYPQCPWYPSVRYFVQSVDGTWGEALRGCQAEIRKMFP